MVLGTDVGDVRGCFIQGRAEPVSDQHFTSELIISDEWVLVY